MSTARHPGSGLPQGVPLLAVTRGGRRESPHRGSGAVVDEEGEVLASAGDPREALFLRSAAKPFQLTPLLAAGGVRRYRLTAREVAVAEASPGGERFPTRALPPARERASAVRVHRAIGIALKVEDGAERGRDAVVREVRQQLGLATGPRLRRPHGFGRPPVRNVRGDVVGELRAVFSLRRPTPAGRDRR